MRGICRNGKPFVMSRKNFLFANTPSGAKSSAIYFSLIDTAKENHLDPYRYLTWAMKTAPLLDMNDYFGAAKQPGMRTKSPLRLFHSLGLTSIVYLQDSGILFFLTGNILYE